MSDLGQQPVGDFSVSALKVEDLCGGPLGTEVLKGLNLEVRHGDVVALMGPNGSGKSTLMHLLMGNPDYEITRGRIWIDGTDVTDAPVEERSRAGLFAAFQYPTELPGIPLADLAREALVARDRDASNVEAITAAMARQIGMDSDLLTRGVNDDFSGGEMKRSEVIQMEILRPSIAVLDEIDSGLDVDALAACADRIRHMANQGTGVLLITHYKLLLDHVPPSTVHIFVDGRIDRSGGPELAAELEASGYQ